MVLSPNHCPADREQVAEDYVMDALDAADLAMFEQHLLVCDECRAAVEDADTFVRAMRGAAGRLRATTASNGD